GDGSYSVQYRLPSSSAAPRKSASTERGWLHRSCGAPGQGTVPIILGVKIGEPPSVPASATVPASLSVPASVRAPSSIPASLKPASPVGPETVDPASMGPSARSGVL